MDAYIPIVLQTSKNLGSHIQQCFAKTFDKTLLSAHKNHRFFMSHFMKTAGSLRLLVITSKIAGFFDLFFGNNQDRWFC